MAWDLPRQRPTLSPLLELMDNPEALLEKTFRSQAQEPVERGRAGQLYVLLGKERALYFGNRKGGLTKGSFPQLEGTCRHLVDAY